MRKLYCFVSVLIMVAVLWVFWLNGRHKLSPLKSGINMAASQRANAYDEAKVAGGANGAREKINSGGGDNVVVEKVLPQRMVNIINARRKSALPALVAELKPGDKAALLEIYKKAALIDRKSIIWALSLMGGDEVCEVFKYSLTKEFSGQKIEMGDGGNAADEELILFEIVRALGFVANTSDSAYKFCINGTDPWFWKSACEWTSNRGSDTVGMLTAYSITAVGISGREDSINVIETLKNKDVVNRTGESSVRGRNYASSIVDAAFFIDRIHDVGHENAKSEYLNGYYEQFLAWSNTENGKKWREWYNVKTKP